MVRLVVNRREPLWDEVARRLRGAELQTTPELHRLANGVSDAVILIGALPTETTAIEPLLKAGKHVLRVMETLWPANAEKRLSEVATENGVQLTLVNPDRFRPSRQLVKQQLDSGKLGTPGLVRLQRWRSLDTGHDTNDGFCAEWLHDLDTVLWLMGRPPELVFATRSNVDVAQNGSDGALNVHLGFDGDGMALMTEWCHLPLGDDYESLSVIGSSGAAYADDHSNRQLAFRGGAAQTARADEGVRAFVSITQDFVDAVAANRDLTASVTGWRRVRNVAEAVRESLASRQSVRLEVR